MDDKEDPREGAVCLKQEELPQMDGSCDACEPDEAQPATQVCHACSFAFCTYHADRHGASTRHQIMPYNHEETQANGRGETSRGNNGVGGEAEEDAGGGGRLANGMGGGDQGMELLGAAMANADMSGDAAANKSVRNGLDGAEGAEAGQEEEAMAAEYAGRRDTVSVERLRCKEHGQEGSLYCKADEKIICVVCAVQGEHRGHEIITLHEGYAWQKSRQGYDLLGCTQQMAEKIKTKWTNPEMSTEELEAYVNGQFDELRRLVRLEEKRTLHLVDLKEAFLTASAAEKIAEISSETERLQEEMASITHQLCLLEEAEAQGMGPGLAVQALLAAPRVQHNVEAIPRLPEPRADPMDHRDLEDNDSGPSMDHAP